MARDKFYEFTKANEYVTNKDKAVNNFVRYMLTRTQSMFTYSGLPDTIPSRNLEYLLQTRGNVFVTRVNGDLYALTGNSGGELNAYGEPTQYTVANAALNLSKTYTIGVDGILIKNDALETGLLPILLKYGALICENTITMRTVDIMLRITALISASDDKTQASAEKFIRDIENGKISVIGESAFFDGVRVQSPTSAQNYLTQFIELEQYLKASCFNEIGLNANYNMKRTQLGSNESALNDDFLLPLVDEMIKQRQESFDKINSMFETSITVDYSSAWKVTHEENEKQIAIAESISESAEQGTANVTVNQKQGVHDINQPIVNIGETPEPEQEEPEQEQQEPETDGEKDDGKRNQG